MTAEELSSQKRAAAQLEDAVTALAKQTTDPAHALDMAELLVSLNSVQKALGALYEQLALRHEASEARGRVEGASSRVPPENPAALRTDLSLEEAAQYSQDAAAALARAHAALGVAQWLDDIQVDDGR